MNHTSESRVERLRRTRRARRKVVLALAIVFVVAVALTIGIGIYVGAHQSDTSPTNSSTLSGKPAPSGARPPKKAQAVARYINCQSSYKDTTPAGREVRRTSPMSSGNCNLGGTAIVIDVYRDRGTRESADNDAEPVACEIATSSGLPRFWKVDGDNFIIFLSNESRAHNVAKLVDSTAVRFECTK